MQITSKAYIFGPLREMSRVQNPCKYCFYLQKFCRKFCRNSAKLFTCPRSKLFYAYRMQCISSLKMTRKIGETQRQLVMVMEPEFTWFLFRITNIYLYDLRCNIHQCVTHMHLLNLQHNSF